MAPEERDPAYVWDMLEVAKDVVEIISGKSRQSWRNNQMLRMAVERGSRLSARQAVQYRRHSGISTLKCPGGASSDNGMCWPVSTARSTTTCCIRPPRGM